MRPQARRRFAATPGARLGLALLGGLVAVAAAADLLACDLPLACRHRGALFILPCLTRPRALAGVDNQGIDGWALRPPVPYGPEQQHPGGITCVWAPPGRAHWLGTDDRGRDVAARLIHGARLALAIGLGAVALGAGLGVGLGLLATLGRALDLVIGRAIEVTLTFPTLLLLLCIQGVTASSSALEVALVVGLTQWPHLGRLVRAEALRALAAPHVEAARGLGLGPLRLRLRHVLPWALWPALTAAAFGLGQAVLAESALTFLGFGVPPPTASWGELLQQAQVGGLRPWLLWPPTLAIALVVAASQLVADGLRAASGELEGPL